MGKKSTSGYIMAAVGFIIILISAASYIFNLDFQHPALTIMGLVFAVIGMGTVRKSKTV